MPTTSNFGWTTPADTDLVKDGAAAIRTLGNGIDTSLVDLKGGTTGQVLSKASNTDLDFTWSSVDPLTILDAKGDLITATAADTPARLASSGINGNVLTVDTSTATGLKWATPSGGANWTLLNTGGTALTGATTITVSGISAADKIHVIVNGASSANAQSVISIRFNGDTANNYSFFGSSLEMTTNYAVTQLGVTNATAESRVVLGALSTTANSTLSGYLKMDGCNAAGVKSYIASGTGDAASTGTNHIFRNVAGVYDSSSVITSVSVVSSTGNFDAGTVFVYTSN